MEFSRRHSGSRRRAVSHGGCRSQDRQGIEMVETPRIEHHGKPSERLMERLQHISVSWPVIVKAHVQGSRAINSAEGLDPGPSRTGPREARHGL